MSDLDFFNGKVKQQEVQQGCIADCYLLAGIAALAELPYRVHKLFYPTKTNPYHCYTVRILFKGKWQNIEIDDHIPFLNHIPAFSFSKSKL